MDGTDQIRPRNTPKTRKRRPREHREQEDEKAGMGCRYLPACCLVWVLFRVFGVFRGNSSLTSYFFSSLALKPGEALNALASAPSAILNTRTSPLNAPAAASPPSGLAATE